MSSNSIVSITQLQLMVQFMQHQQIALSDVFDSEQLALISAACTSQQVSHVPSLQFEKILRQLAIYLDRPQVGLDIAMHVSTAHLGVLGYLLHACDNLAEALLRLKRYGRLIINDLDQMSIQQTGGNIELLWPPPSSDGILLELGMANMRRFSVQLTGRNLPLNHIHFAHPLTGQLETYEKFFGCPVHFNQPLNIMSFPAPNLKVPIEKPDKALLNILQEQAEQALQHLPDSDSFLQQVQRHLVQLCQQGEPTLAQLAGQLHLSSRTLQRRLNERQVSFQQLLDEVRQQLCKQYLHQQVPLSDIAQLIGYSDQSAFTRAYKRWTGSTPFQQRRGQQDQDS
ncbi:AraC family transcriptional regulator ligand-binding domain-containing protein [Alkanindiges sp. WGS2144]|uniref:AraC family transcriptional regulator n=1 Tax=Alkanindiges sp. WGS2144 TaxID=3366808 RepID=UPI0037509C52